MAVPDVLEAGAAEVDVDVALTAVWATEDSDALALNGRKSLAFRLVHVFYAKGGSRLLVRVEQQQQQQIWTYGAAARQYCVT